MTKQETVKQDIKKLRQNKQFLAILVLLFVIMLFWIIISLITSQTSEKISPELQKLSKTLTPVIDTSVFEEITRKRQYTESELSAFTIFKVLTSRDGRTQRVVPLEVTIEDIDSTQDSDSTSNSQSQSETQDSLLQQEIQENPSNQTSNPTPTPEAPTIPFTQTQGTTNLGGEL